MAYIAVECAFDAYCRKVIINNKKNNQARKKRICCVEFNPDAAISLSLDNYFLKIYSIDGLQIEIKDEDLYDCLNLLPTIDQRIIFYYYGVGYSDVAIAKLLSAPKSTVNYRRHNALKQLRKLLCEV